MEEEKTKQRYRKIQVRTWADAKFRALSPIPPCGAGLWFFLLTGPHTGPIPGLFRAGRASMAEELGWEQEAFDKAFAEVFAEGMAKADFRARLVWLPKAIDHNRPESPNVVKSWGGEFDLLPECDLKDEALAHLSDVVCSMGEGFEKAFKATFGNALRKASAKASGKASVKTMPNQEQEQEQEQEKTSATSAPVAGVADDRPADQVEGKGQDVATDQAHQGDQADDPAGAGDQVEGATIKPDGKAPPACPHQEIIALYHDMLPMCPRVRQWTEKRQRQLRGRWNEDKRRQNLDYWTKFFEYVAGSRFLTGRSGGDRPFLADLEWLTNPSNFVKVIEGKYE